MNDFDILESNIPFYTMHDYEIVKLFAELYGISDDLEWDADGKCYIFKRKCKKVKGSKAGMDLKAWYALTLYPSLYEDLAKDVGAEYFPDELSGCYKVYFEGDEPWVLFSKHTWGFDKIIHYCIYKQALLAPGGDKLLERNKLLKELKVKKGFFTKLIEKIQSYLHPEGIHK